MLIISVSYDMQHKPNITCSECWCSACTLCRICQVSCLRWSVVAFYYCHTNSHHYYQVKEVWWPWNQAQSSQLLWNSSITVLEVFCASIMIQNILFFQMQILRLINSRTFRTNGIVRSCCQSHHKFAWMNSRSWKAI